MLAPGDPLPNPDLESSQGGVVRLHDCFGQNALVVYFYIRDCVELGGLIATTLILLRMGAFLGLLWIFLLPQHRIERPVTINSRLVLTIDTSGSMNSIKDEGSRLYRLE